MINARNLLDSLGFLVSAAVLTFAAMTAYIFPASTYVSERSESVVRNFYLIGGFMLLLALASVAQFFLSVRLIWGPRAVPSGVKPSGSTELDDDDVRAIRATGAKKGLLLVVLLVANIMVFDKLGQGVIVTGTRVHLTLTLLRSTSARDRREMVLHSIMLVGDKRITGALKHALEEPGQGREWVAYAAGVRNDVELAGSLEKLLETGTPRERAASAVALARLNDPRMIRRLSGALAQDRAIKGDLFKALGMLKGESLEDEDVAFAADVLNRQIDSGSLDVATMRVAIWAIGRLEAPQGRGALERLLEIDGQDLGTTCTVLHALGRIGSADTSPILLDMIFKVDKKARCPELVHEDISGHEVLLCQGTNLVERLLYEIARIGDRRAIPITEKLGRDRSFSEQVRYMADEIARKMRSRPES